MQAARKLSLLALALSSACATKDPVQYAKYLTDNKASAIAADTLIGKVTPLFTGYGSLNDAVPSPTLVNCHYGATHLGRRRSPFTAQRQAAATLSECSLAVGTCKMWRCSFWHAGMQC